MIDFLKNPIKKLMVFSLKASNKARNEAGLKSKLEEIVPDLTDQYSTFKINMDDEYLSNKIRGQHAFQISLAQKAIEFLDKDEINIVDIGDSAGTHLIYLNKLLEDKNINTLSINLDKVAVEKIKSKGLSAMLCKAEELHLQKDGIDTDIFLSYEMLEHLISPIEFLRSMAEKSKCEYFAITIPYQYKSRVAIQFVKNRLDGEFEAENTHIFEFSPQDWDLIFEFSGWEIVYRDKYTQYPQSFPLNLTKCLWRRIDFDGFYGVILKKNNKYSKRYLDW